MYEGLSFDELNVLYKEKGVERSEPIDEYFTVMDISDRDRKRREETAEELEEVMLMALMMLFYMAQEGSYDYGAVQDMMFERYTAIVAGMTLTDSFQNTHIQNMVTSVISTTMSDPEDMWNFSYDRARLIAENESNSIWEDSDFAEAVLSGKTMKTWHTILDKYTRDTHRSMASKTIPIMEPFEVGDYLMMYPKDESLGAGMEEIANCRCTVSYH